MRSGAGTNQEAVRRHNLGTLLGHVHRLGRISRASLTTTMELNRSTIAGLVGELEALGLAEQAAPVASRNGAGRPSPDVVPRADGAYVLAVDVGVSGLEVARVGLGGEVLARVSAPIPASRTPEATVEAVVALLRDVVGDASAGSALVGVGVSVPGLVRRSDGLVRLAPNLGWTDLPFGEVLAERLGALADVRVGNDADLGALAEHVRGAGLDDADLIYLSGEVGVGAGIILDGHHLGGGGGYAGEIGHLQMDPAGQLCHCGNCGCWETQIGAPAIAKAVGCPHDQVASLGEFLAGMEEPNDALRQVGHDLGRGIASAVNLLNPRVVVLGGYLRPLYRLVREEVDTTLHSHALVAPREQVRVTLPALGADTVLVGAAEMAFAPLLQDPVAVLSHAATDVDRIFAGSA
ncbi:ROK family protein [Aeromicrobium sp. CTD01-1L150]|uniref:ROK family protein n=1 Tax=Aeromicrobium sp. CTD01-1L150 TaxID=3341830 RepID=UPI0035C0DE3D